MKGQGFSKKIVLISVVLIYCISLSAFKGGLESYDKDELEALFQHSAVYKATNEVFEDGIGNDKSEMAWGVAENIIDILTMFEATQDSSYLDSAYKYIMKMKETRDDNRGVVTYTAKDSSFVILPTWRNLSYSKWIRTGDLHDTIFRYDSYGNIIHDEYNDDCFAYPWLIHTASITLAMTKFFSNAFDPITLKSERYPDVNGINFLYDIKTSIDVHNQEWYNFGEFSTYTWLDNSNIDKVHDRLVYHERDEDNNPVNCNYFAKMGSSLIAFYQLTGDPDCKQKAISIVEAFKKILGVDGNDAYIWKYHYGEPDSSIRTEDISHSSWTHQVVFDYYNSSLNSVCQEFSYQDMKKLANTFMRNLFAGDIEHGEWRIINQDEYAWITFMPDGVYDIKGFVDGHSYDEDSCNFYKTKSYYTDWRRTTVADWIPMCIYDPRIYEVGYNICDSNNYSAIRNLFYYYDYYKPCEVSIYPESLYCDSTYDLRISLDNVKILGDLVIRVYQPHHAVYFEGIIHRPKTADTIWTIRLPLDNIRIQHDSPLLVSIYSDNSGIVGPLRIYEKPIEVASSISEISRNSKNTTSITIDYLRGLANLTVLDETKILIYDITGRQQMNRIIQKGNHQLDISLLSAGIYFIKLGDVNSKIFIVK